MVKTRQARRPMRYKPLLIFNCGFPDRERGKESFVSPLMWERADMGCFPSFGPLSLCACISCRLHYSRGPRRNARRGVAASVASAISHFVAASRVDMVVIYWRLEAQGEGA